MFIKSSYLIEEGKDPAEGCIVKKCRFCKGTFGVPVAEANDPNAIDVCDCGSCKEAYEKQVAADANAAAKAGAGSEDISKALGK